MDMPPRPAGPAPAAVRRRRQAVPPRRWLAWAAALVPVLLFAAAEWARWPFLRAPLERAASRALQRDVQLGAGFGLRLLGAVRLHAGTLVVGPPTAQARPGAASEGFLRADGVQLTLSYGSMLAAWRGPAPRPLRVQALQVRHLDLQLQRQADGTASWHFGPQQPAPGNGQPGRRPAPRFEPQFDHFVVQAGRITLDDRITQLSLKAVLGAAGTLPQETPPPAPPTGSSAPDETPAAASDRAAMAAGLQARATGTYRGTALQARLATAGLLPLVAAATHAAPAHAVPFRLDLQLGSISLDLAGRARDLARLTGLAGRFHLAGPSLAAVGDALGLALPTTAAFTTRGDIGKNGNRWQAVLDELSIGSSRLRGEFRYEALQPVGRLSGTLAGTRLWLPDLGPAFGAGAQRGAAARPRPSGDRVLPQREFDLPALGRMQADVVVRLDAADLGTPLLAPLTPLHATVVLRDKVLSIRDLLARSAGGDVQGSVSLDARTDSPRWQGDLRWSGVRLERLVQARNRNVQPRPAAGRRPAPATASAADTAFISGSLSGQARLQGHGRSSAAMLASLDGSMRLWVRDGRISHLVVEMLGIDLAESLGLLVRGDATLPLRCAVAQVNARDGRLQVDTGVLDTPDTTVQVSGALSLAQERLALRLRARPRDFSPLALRVPLHLEGSFAQPQVRVNLPGIGARVAAAAGLAAAAPLAGLLALFDLGEPERAACEQAWQRVQDAQPSAP
jgi:uncharacterized protein involved in outer membrane biogenesis